MEKKQDKIPLHQKKIYFYGQIITMIQRILKEQLVYWSGRNKALVVTGARQVGKTTLLKDLYQSANILWLNADDAAVRNKLENTTLSSIIELIGNHQTIIIDEIQRVVNPGVLLKIMVDNFSDKQFIVTGSSALELSDKLFEPLTGRHLLFHLYPFSFAELYRDYSVFEIEQKINFHLVYGFYPDVCSHPADAKVLLTNLANQYLYKDVLVWKDIRKPELLDKLLQLLAYQTGSEVSTHELAKTLKVKSETVANYIDLLEKAFVIFRLKAYSTNGRKEVSKMSKIYFWDNGIRNTVLGDHRSVENRNDIGALWENLMVSERMKMNAWKSDPPKSFFWRNTQQREVDYLEVHQGEISAFEMKWNTQKNKKLTRAFTNLYPHAQTHIVSPVNFKAFCFLE
jgi:predicted AAA+ superfamily ATPase